MNEPVADAVRSILDGHVVLTRCARAAGHYPAIDVLQSVSRLMGEIVSREVQSAGQQLRGALAVLHEKEDLVAIGAYQQGTDPPWTPRSRTAPRSTRSFARQSPSAAIRCRPTPAW